MSFNFKKDGAWNPLLTGWVKVSDTWQQITSAWVKVSGAWQQVFTSLSASVLPTIVSAGQSGASPCGNPGTTTTVTVTPDGGTPPYTYAWAREGVAADSGPYQATSPAGAVTAFNDVDSSVCAADTNKTETWRCTVTDDNSQTATTDVTVILTWTDIT